MKTDKRFQELNSDAPNNLLKISDSFSGALDPSLSGAEESLLRHIAALTAKLLSRGEASVFLVTGPPDKPVITYKAGSSDKAHQRLKGFQLQIGEGLVGYTIKTGQPQLIADVHELKDSKNGSALSSAASELPHSRFRSLICAPMSGPDQIMGAIEVGDELPNRFADADLNLLSSVAGFATWLMQEARQRQVLKRQSELLDAGVKVISQIFARLDNLDRLFEKITDSLHLNFDFDYVGLHLFDNTEDQSHDKTLRLKAASGKKRDVAVDQPTVFGNNSTMGWAITYGKPCIGLHIGEQEFSIRYVNPSPKRDKLDVSEFVAGNKLLARPSSAITLPLAAYGEALGAIIIQNEGPTFFAEENFPEEAINVLQTLANQLAFIIYHSRTYRQVELKKQNLEIIQDIDRQIIGTTDQNLTENLRLILLKGLEFIEAESGQIFRYDQKTKTLVEKVATTESYIKEPQPVEGIFEHVVSAKKSVLIEELKAWEPAARMNSRLTVPLITGDLVVGIFNADSPRLRAFNQRHQEILEALAPQATIAIQNAYLFRRVNHRASLLQVASEVSSNAISIRNLDDLLATTVKTIVEKFGYYHAAIFQIDEEAQEWAVLRTGSGEAGKKLAAEGYRLRVGSSTPVGQVTGPFRKSCFVSYVDQDGQALKAPYLPETRSEIALPLSVKAGKKYKVLGALNVHSTEETPFPKRDKALLQAMADQLAVIINNNVLYRRSEAEQQLVKVLRAIDRHIINPEDTKTDILNFILAESCRLTGAEDGQIFLVEDDNELKVEIATDKRDRNAKVQTVVGTVIGDAIFRGQILITDLKQLLPGEKNSAGQPNGQGIDYSLAYKKNKRSRAAVRFYEEDSNIVGVLSVEHSEPGQFTSAHIEILLALAGQAAITIKNRALVRQAEIRNRQLEATAQVGADIISSLDVEELLKKTVELIRQKFYLYYAAIFLIEKVEEKEPRQKVARLKAASSFDEHQLLKGDHQFEVGGKSIVGYTTSTGRAKITRVDVAGGQATATSNNLTLPQTISKMTLPLRNRKGVIGALEVQSVETIFTEKDTQTLQTMADQLATAIYNAELYQHIEQDKLQLAALRDIDRAIISTELNLDETLKLILTRGLDLIEARHGSLSLLEPDQQHLIVFVSSQKHEIGSVLPVNKSILGLAVEQRRSIRIPDISLEPRYQTDYNLFSGTQIKSTLLVPLKENGSITGVFSAYSTQTNAFSKKQQDTLETMAGQAAIAINNASLYSQAQRRAALLKAAAKVSQSVISVLDLDQLLDKIVNTICDEFEDREFHYAAVFLVDDAHNYVQQRAGSGKIGREMVDTGFQFKIGLDNSIVNAVIRSGQGIIEEYNLYPDERSATLRLLPDTQSEMALPLKLGHNVIGALTVHSRQKDAFTDEDTQTLQSMADQLAIAIDNVKKQEKLVEAESLRSIAEATSQSMHWVANQTAPIQYWVNKIEEMVEPVVRRPDVDGLIQEDFYEGIGIIRENVNRILEVKTGIMGTAREFKLGPARLHEIVEKILRNLDFPPDYIEQRIASQLPLVQVDPTAIEEVFRNLFVNAVQAMKDIKSPRLEVKAEITETANFVKATVTDNGSGIAEDKIRDIWKPFYTTKAGSGGTGVGLSYCLQAMHKMGGEISVESKIGQGTTFTVEIPVYVETTSNSRSHAERGNESRVSEEL